MELFQRQADSRNSQTLHNSQTRRVGRFQLHLRQGAGRANGRARGRSFAGGTGRRVIGLGVKLRSGWPRSGWLGVMHLLVGRALFRGEARVMKGRCGEIDEISGAGILQKKQVNKALHTATTVN